MKKKGDVLDNSKVFGLGNRKDDGVAVDEVREGCGGRVGVVELWER